MSERKLKLVIFGLSITSSWGNGHATTYRGLVRELFLKGHDVLFLERDRPWYAANRDLPNPSFGRFALYSSLNELRSLYGTEVRDADVVIVGSYVPEGVEVGEWVIEQAKGIKAFYDIDTPVTLAKLHRGDFEYLSPALIEKYDLYLSFTGGPVLRTLENTFKSPMAKPLYCSADVLEYHPESHRMLWDLGYLGTYSDDRQPAVQRFLIEPAARLPRSSFVVAGPQYPAEISWGANVKRIEHLPPNEHRRFYTQMRFALNVTRKDMIRAGYSPSIRLFEAAACGTPIITDYWEGLDTVFDPGTEILVARTSKDVERYLTTLPEEQRLEIGARARARVFSQHTSAKRAAQLEQYVAEAQELRSKINLLRRAACKLNRETFATR